MKTKRDIIIDVINISIDTLCVMIGVYMMRELYHDVKEFNKRG